jgi:hypothetical protein
MDNDVRATRRLRRLLVAAVDHYEAELNLMAWALCLAVALGLGAR